MKQYELVAATSSDQAALYHVHKAAMKDLVTQVWGWDEPLQVRMFDDHFTRAHLQKIVVEGQTVGYVDVLHQPDQVCVVNLVIHPSQQGHGIGTAILRDVIEDSRSMGLPLCLQVLKVNERARNLYERMGFALTGATDTHFTMELRAGDDPL